MFREDLELGIILDTFCRQPPPWMNGKTGYFGINPISKVLKPALRLLTNAGRKAGHCGKTHSSIITIIG